MKAFTKWLADHGKLAHDPLRTVKRPSAKADRRLRRRMLLPTEWPYRQAATLTNGLRDGMNPLERVTLYAVAVQTGLRASELRSLTKSDLFLAGLTPYIKTVMRHSCITLTMETYGHLLPDQHAEAVVGMGRLMDAGKTGFARSSRGSSSDARNQPGRCEFMRSRA